jgi:translocation and assembly module TamB
MSKSRIIGRGLLLLLLLSMIALALAWAARKDIARNYVDAEIKRRGVAARYEITAIGPSRQRLERISLGDPANPDLTAEWAEIITHTGFDGVSLSRIRAGGVRIKGRQVGDRFSFGAVDKLLPAPSDQPFSLPDLEVALSDVRVRLDTPRGAIGLRIDGSGNIARNFSGRLAAVVPQAQLQPGCAAAGLTAYVALETRARQISVKGPVRAGSVTCSGLALAAPEIQLGLTTDERLSRIDADIVTRSGAVGVADIGARAGGGQARLNWADGRLSGEGDLALTRIQPGEAQLRPLVALTRSAEATPLGAIAAGLGRAIGALGRGIDVSTKFSVDGSANAGRIDLDNLVARSLSGATMRMTDGAAASVNWPGGSFGISGDVALSGGGFPAANVRFTRGAAISGVATIAPLTSGGSRLTLAPLSFSLAKGQSRLTTTARFDGALGGGFVRGLIVPVAIANGAMPGRCLPLALQSFTRDTLVLAPLRTTLCMRGGLVTTGATTIRARLGTSPLSLAFGSARYDLADGVFAAEALALRVGDESRLTRLDVSGITGRYRDSIASGRFTDTAGRIANVPLLLSEGTGDWRFAGGALSLTGGLRLADSDKSPRFLPLRSDDLALRLADGAITATATLREPFSGTSVTKVTMAHDLARSSGSALLDVPGLTFGQALQPERLTSVTLGVIANVQGTLAGQGEIFWNDDGVTSRGRFATDNLDFAAAFGPVNGLKGEIRFSDLLGLATPPGQRVTIAAINPGVAVTDGVIRYRLLPGLKLAIEDGRWPFAGGELSLAPATLDLNQSAERRLTFRVDGLDAALFVQQMAFDNIAVTGRFDGMLPMVFDQTGGRIEDGNLTVRGDGGTLSYIGDVSNAELGRFSRLAFDALKSIRYRRLTLELDGALDGEMVTVVRFNGVNQLPLAQSRNFFLKQFNEIPFLFNITIKAPFRGLFSMVRSFNDPSVFIPRGLETLPPPPPPSVQTKESETMQ